jgi:hypothetical protein
VNPEPSIDCSGAPVVTLAGREWFVPVLAMRQARIVVPALMRLMPVLQSLQSGEAAPLSEQDYDAILDVVHAALTRAYPRLTREEFLDLPASTPELIAALAVVTRQTGFFKPADGGEDHPGEALGEAAKASTAPQEVSTGSSPIIASAPENPGTTP